mmetsp:Transcript_16270/g.32981  ORF Transcript_16270/g.32981 Transcript_16270/m.32981 type:complete len:201 (+) Transcript_16270:1307-1909(+)
MNRFLQSDRHRAHGDAQHENVEHPVCGLDHRVVLVRLRPEIVPGPLNEVEDRLEDAGAVVVTSEHEVCEGEVVHQGDMARRHPDVEGPGHQFHLVDALQGAVEVAQHRLHTERTDEGEVAEHVPEGVAELCVPLRLVRVLLALSEDLSNLTPLCQLVEEFENSLVVPDIRSLKEGVQFCSLELPHGPIAEPFPLVPLFFL